jgi:hypothetical protein
MHYWRQHVTFATSYCLTTLSWYIYIYICSLFYCLHIYYRNTEYWPSDSTDKRELVQVAESHYTRIAAANTASGLGRFQKHSAQHTMSAMQLYITPHSKCTHKKQSYCHNDVTVSARTCVRCLCYCCCYCCADKVCYCCCCWRAITAFCLLVPLL